MLRREDIKIYEFDFYQIGEVPPDKIMGYENYRHWRFAISGGYSHHTAGLADDTPPDFRNYAKRLKSGYSISGDATYYFNETIGIGAKASISKSSNSIDNIYVTDASGHTVYGKMSDDISIIYIGPTLSTKFFNRAKSNSINALISFGYLSYSNNAVLINSYKITGSTFGMSADIGYDIGLTENLSLGFQISSVLGVLRAYDYNDGTSVHHLKLEDQLHSLNRMDFSVGLRFLM